MNIYLWPFWIFQVRTRQCWVLVWRWIYLQSNKWPKSLTVYLIDCKILSKGFKGCGMGPWLVLESPCFRENVVATCKIESFLCSLDNLPQKNLIVFFFGKSNFKMALIWKKGYFWSTFQGKVTKIPSAHISLTYIHVFCSPYWPFCLTNFDKNTNLSGMVSLWYDSWCWFLFAPFWNNQ